MEIGGLKTITDFDLGVGGSDMDFIRVSEITADVTLSEINLFTWILLEQEFSKLKDSGILNCGDGDSIDARVDAFERDGPRPNFNARNCAARKYSEELLRAVGVSLPFELLSPSKREALFRLFSSQSNLLKQEKYSSILDLYEALRRRSKFREQFDVIDMLGRGEFGVVYAIQTREPGERDRFALKQITISSFDALDSIKMILNESKILQKLDQHPNIVSFFDAWLEVHESDTETLVPVFFLQMELGYLPLSRWKEENAQLKLSSTILLTITHQLLDALDWIHDKSCLHLDVNPKNILWADATCQSVKLVDFGLAVTKDICHERRGTVPYCAPESTLNGKSDVYSLGVTLFEVSQNISTRSELMKRLESSALHTNFTFLDRILPLMLRKHPSQRPTTKDVLVMLSHE